MPTCFVIQGFGRKTDYTDGRVLDLDASYAIIKDAVECAGLECIRADEINHSGVIDLPMYQHLLDADLVIADLSTYNVNAVFELGVRYALRPHATIVLAEEEFKPVFDVSHVVIRRYKHMGEDIGVKAAKSLKDELVTAIHGILALDATKRAVDSPVYTFLQQLQPPAVRRAAEAMVAAGVEMAMAVAAAAPESEGPGPSNKVLLDASRRAMNDGDFGAAQELLQQLRARKPSDHHVVQQLALATYKHKSPDARAALLEAREVLRVLQPDTTNDPETLGLWGAIHKRLWDLDGDRTLLDASIDAYGRGFNLKQDHYNGINYALLLELRGLAEAKGGSRDEAVADRVNARRVRQSVLDYLAPVLGDAARLGEMESSARYWLLASAKEARVGLAQDTAAIDAALAATKPAPWMLESTSDQITRMQAVQQELGALLG